MDFQISNEYIRVLYYINIYIIRCVHTRGSISGRNKPIKFGLCNNTLCIHLMARPENIFGGRGVTIYTYIL